MSGAHITRFGVSRVERIIVPYGHIGRFRIGSRVQFCWRTSLAALSLAYNV